MFLHNFEAKNNTNQSYEKHNYILKIRSKSKIVGKNNRQRKRMNDLCKIERMNTLCISSQQDACETKPFPCGDNEVCVPDYQSENFKCDCVSGYSGQPCSK